MWDLDTLHYLNYQAHLRAVERSMEASQGNAATNPTAPVYPLSILARNLIVGPPSISYIVELLQNSEVVAYFMELVSQYLPDHEDEIRAAFVDDRIRLFTHYFEQQYFPLYDESLLDEFALEDFVRQIPVDLMGFTYEDYHDFSDFRTGYILLLSLIESPFYVEDDGGRVPILDYIGDLLGRDIVALLPKDGWEPDELHKLTDGTKFEGVGNYADWVHSNTGCWQLDANYGDYEGEPWHEQTVATLAEQWPKVCEIQEKIRKVVELVEENPRQRYLELLDLLLEVNPKEFIIPDEQLRLPLDDKGQVIST